MVLPAQAVTPLVRLAVREVGKPFALKCTFVKVTEPLPVVADKAATGTDKLGLLSVIVLPACAPV